MESFNPIMIDKETNKLIHYKDFVQTLAKPGEEILASLTPEKCNLLHMALGVAGEAGELVDAIKKHVIYGKELDIENVKEELGDLNFFMTEIQRVLNITDEDVISHNVEKLRKRYKEGYSDKAAIERDDKIEEDTKFIGCRASQITEIGVDIGTKDPEVNTAICAVSETKVEEDVKYVGCSKEGFYLYGPFDTEEEANKWCLKGLGEYVTSVKTNV